MDFDFEYLVYLSTIIYKTYYLHNKNILLDLYCEELEKIYHDFIEYDNKNGKGKTSIQSIEEYLEENNDKIKSMIFECLE